MKTPASALLWEIWWKSRAALLGASCITIICGIGYRVAAPYVQGNQTALHLAFVPMFLALAVTLHTFHFTEGDRRGGFGQFPRRLFRLPVSTFQLVVWPCVAGTVALCGLYGLWSTVVLSPLTGSLPLLWPSVFLAAGLIFFQTSVWLLARFPLAKMLALGMLGTSLVFGWIIFKEEIASVVLTGLFGTPEGWPAQRILVAGVSVTSIAAFLTAWAGVQTQRHGGFKRINLAHAQIPSAIRRLVRGRLRSKSTCSRAFASPASAQFHYEFRRAGLVLPFSMLIVLAFLGVATLLSHEFNGNETVVVLALVLSAPLVVGFVIGRAFVKPDFWNSDLSFPTFVSLRPLTSEDWVFARIKAAFASALLAWIAIATGAVVWAAHYGDLTSIFQWLDAQISQSGPLRVTLIVTCGLMTAVFLTWRFLIGMLPAGMLGDKTLFYLMQTLVWTCVAALVCLGVFLSEEDYWRLRLPARSSWICWFVASVSIAHFTTATILLNRLWNSGRISTSRLVSMFVVYAISVLSVETFLLALDWKALWQQSLLMQLAIFILPPASPGLAIWLLHHGRQGERRQRRMPSADRSLLRFTCPNLVFTTLLGSFSCFALLLAHRSALHWPKMVTVENRSMRMLITGNGPVTVVFESGAGGTLEAWSSLQPRVARFATTVSYDRLGLGGSDPGTGPRTASRAVRELRAALTQAGLNPPYIIVGHSLGGLHARMFAHLYPNEVSGLVLIDPTSEEILDDDAPRWVAEHFPEDWRQVDADIRSTPEVVSLFWSSNFKRNTERFWNAPAELKSRWRDVVLDLREQELPGPLIKQLDETPAGVREEYLSLPETMRELRGIGFQPNLELAILTSTKIPLQPNAARKSWAGAGRAWWLSQHSNLAAKSPRAIHIVTDQSGHSIQEDDPSLVVRSIRRIFESITGKM